MLYGDYYNQDPQNIVSAIITQMGDEYLFDCYYNRFAIGCSCSSANTLTCGYILSRDLDPVDETLDVNWLPIHDTNNCGTLCAA